MIVNPDYGNPNAAKEHFIAHPESAPFCKQRECIYNENCGCHRNERCEFYAGMFTKKEVK
jgi:hypothetical protein